MADQRGNSKADEQAVLDHAGDFVEGMRQRIGIGNTSK